MVTPKLEIGQYLNLNGLQKIGLTFDIDWAPDFVIKDIFDCLESFDFAATAFCTHPSVVLQGTAYPKVERGLHPNFLPNSTQGQSPEEIMKYLRKNYPDGIGIRCHSLTYTCSYWNLFSLNGIKYESNLLLQYQEHIKPFYHHSGILRIPFIWADDNHILYGREFSVDQMRLNLPGLKVVNFHPLNIYLNLGHDSKPKDRIKSLGIPLNTLTEKQIKRQVRKGRGTRKLFEDFLMFLEKEDMGTYSLKELYCDVPNGYY